MSRIHLFRITFIIEIQERVCVNPTQNPFQQQENFCLQKCTQLHLCIICKNEFLGLNKNPFQPLESVCLYFKPYSSSNTFSYTTRPVFVIIFLPLNICFQYVSSSPTQAINDPFFTNGAIA